MKQTRCPLQTPHPTPLMYNVMITVKNHIQWCLVRASITVDVMRKIGLQAKSYGIDKSFGILICPGFNFDDILTRHQIISATTELCE